MANAIESADQSKQLDLHVKRALLYEKLGRPDEAENAWQRVDALGTGDIEQEWLAIMEKHQRWYAIARHYSRQIDKHPEGWICHASRSNLILKIIERDDPVFDHLQELRPNDLLLPVCKGRALVMESKWKEAAEYYARLEEGAPFSEAWYEYAAVLVLAGREEEFAKTTRLVEELTRGTNSQTVGYSLARTATIAPAEVIPWDTVVKWGALGNSNGSKGWNIHVPGLTQLRAGNLDKTPVGNLNSTPSLAVSHFSNRENTIALNKNWTSLTNGWNNST